MVIRTEFLRTTSSSNAVLVFHVHVPEATPDAFEKSMKSFSPRGAAGPLAKKYVRHRQHQRRRMWQHHQLRHFTLAQLQVHHTLRHAQCDGKMMSHPFAQALSLCATAHWQHCLMAKMSMVHSQQSCWTQSRQPRDALLTACCCGDGDM